MGLCPGTLLERQCTQLHLSFGKDPGSCATRMPRAPMAASGQAWLNAGLPCWCRMLRALTAVVFNL